MRRYESAGQAQHCLACFGPIRGRVCPRPHRLAAPHYREVLATRFRTWRQVANLPTTSA